MEKQQKLSSEYFFLLGGHDLEMLEIRSILERQGYRENLDFLDKKLTWGAALSAYQNEFHPHRINVGIELVEDIPPPENYLRIDHHNESSDLPASIEQVAELLAVELNRDQQLVAANDKGYIPAMLEMGATPEEIDDIRRRDRAAQGVTEEAERLAEQSIRENREEIKEITVIYALTDHFSAIADRLFRQTDQLLVYTDEELTYYGKEQDRLVQHFANYIKRGRAYYGGGESGYFGVGKGRYGKRFIKKLVNEIIQIAGFNLYSYHVFLFPFKWEALKYRGQAEAFEKTTAGVNFQEALGAGTWDKKKETKRWYRKPYALSSITKYNEFNYFYDFAREVMYDLSDDLVSGENNSQDIIHHFKYFLDRAKYPKFCFEVFIKKTKNSRERIKTYKLELEDLILNVYNTGVGVLSFHLNNRSYEKEEDILRINQFGRRIYPPFYSHNHQKKEDPWGAALAGTQKSELAQKTWIEEDGQPIPNLSEDFKQYSDPEQKELLKHTPFHLPGFIKGLFPAADQITTIEKPLKNQNARIFISPVLDDRMFVLCWYGNSDTANRLKKSAKSGVRFQTDDFWYQYIFVDAGGKGLWNSELQTELAKQHTYTRWQGGGTFYGVSRYSLICLSDNLEDLKKHKVVFILHHMQTLYYKMAELVLVQRASILRFSDEITHVASLDSDKVTGLINNLYKNYIRFINKIHFREVTAQEQGIELYDLLHEKMRVEKDLKDLAGEMQELNNYANRLEENKRIELEQERNDRLELITIIGALFFIPSFITGFFGMNIFSNGLDDFSIPQLLSILALIFLVSIAILSFFASQRSGKTLFKKKEIPSLNLILSLVILLVLLPVLFMAFVKGMAAAYTGVLLFVAVFIIVFILKT